jgi:hypothetical protein
MPPQKTSNNDALNIMNSSILPVKNRKMRTFVVFFFYFVNISVYGQSFETNFVVKNAYYVSIDIETKQDYPIMFDILLDKNDSLLVDASNKHNFINGILQNSIYSLLLVYAFISKKRDNYCGLRFYCVSLRWNLNYQMA